MSFISSENPRARHGVVLVVFLILFVIGFSLTAVHQVKPALLVVECQLGNQDMTAWHKLEIDSEGVARLYVGSKGARGMDVKEFHANDPEAVVALCDSLSLGPSFEGGAVLGFPYVIARCSSRSRTRDVIFPVKITNYPFDWIYDRRFLSQKEFSSRSQEVKMFLDALNEVLLHFGLTSDHLKGIGPIDL
jgi:hypothetical protein